MPTPINNLTFRPSDATPTHGVHAQHHDEIAATIAGRYSVMSYGAKGDNATDDTVAIQAAMDAATLTHGTVYFPPGTYKITAALQLPSGNGFTDVGAITIQGAGRNGTCVEQATVNTPIFVTGGTGLFGQTMTFRDIRLQYAAQASTAHTQSYAIGFDGTPTDTAGFTIERCWINRAYVAVGINKTSGSTDAWNLRIADTWITSTRHSAVKLNSPTPVGMPSNYFEHVFVTNTGAGALDGLPIASNGPCFDFVAASVTMHDIDVEGWVNTIVAYSGNPHALTAQGFYVEHHIFDNTTANPWLFDVSSDIVVDGFLFSGVANNVGAYMFAVTNANAHVRGAASSITFTGGGFAGAFLAGGTTSRIYYDRDWRANVGAISVPDFSGGASDALVGGARTLAYSASIATDISVASDKFKIVVTNGTAFTITTPTNPLLGKVIIYDIKNSSGGAHGVITWGTGFLNGGAGTVGTGALTGIANGKRRTISFYYDGTNWIELSRTADQ